MIAAALLIRARGSLGDWRRAIDPPLFTALAAMGRVAGDDRGTHRFGPLVMAGLVTAVALAGPALRRPEAEAFRNLDGLAVAVDLSRSMTESDGFGDARFAASEVVASAGSRQAALVVFAGDAYLAATFTADHAALGELIAALGPDLVPEQGSDPARALAFAGRRLSEAAILAGDVVLVTDGGGISDAGPRRGGAARRERHAGARAARGWRRAGTGRRGGRRAARRGGWRPGGDGGRTGRDRPGRRRQPHDTARAQSFAALGWYDLGRPMMGVAALLVLASFRRRR